MLHIFHKSIAIISNFAFVAMAIFSTSVYAEIVVVMPAKTNVEKLSRNEVINIYMGRYRILPDGQTAKPIDLPLNSPERRLFYKKLLDKQLEDVNAYWARLIFSGRTEPPNEVGNKSIINELMASNSNIVAYLDRKNISHDMKIVFTLPE